jgi:hypothetical protein
MLHNITTIQGGASLWPKRNTVKKQQDDNIEVEYTKRGALKATRNAAWLQQVANSLPLKAEPSMKKRRAGTKTKYFDFEEGDCYYPHIYNNLLCSKWVRHIAPSRSP